MSDREFDPKQPGQHGRFVDETIGTLMGEAAQQKTKKTIDLSLKEPSERLATEYPDAPEGPTYYEQPILQTPVWIWSVPVYFYIGGTAGAALLLGSAVQSVNGQVLRGLVRKCRWIGTLGIGLGSGMLIWDLGYKRRFLNMLRVFRPTSPLNVGSWLLTSGGSLAGASALLTDAPGVLRTAGDLAAHLAGVLGMPLAGYTGVVLADTAVPAWQEARRMLPVLFIGSAMAGTASFLEMMDLNRREEAIARRYGIIGKATELASTFAIEQEASRIAHVGRPFRHGWTGFLWRIAQGLSAASLLLSVLPGRSKRKHRTAGVLGSLGALAIRFAIFEVGKASANDPRATFQKQRAGHGGAEITGKAAIAGPNGERAAAPGPRPALEVTERAVIPPAASAGGGQFEPERTLSGRSG